MTKAPRGPDPGRQPPAVAKVVVHGIPKRFSKLDEATTSYFADLSGHLRNIGDEEERLLLASNALGEAEGKAVAVASDPTCSRSLEALLDAAPPVAACKFARSLFVDDKFQEMSLSPCGSRVAQHLIKILERSLQPSFTAEEDATEEAQKLLRNVADAIGASLYRFVVDANGSHVARQLLVAAAGYDVTPAQSSPPPAASSGVQAASAAEQAGGSCLKGLAAKVTIQSGSGSRTGLPELLEPIVAAILSSEMAESLAEELPYNPYSSPFLQSLLLAQSENREFLEALIPRFFGLLPTAQESSSSFEDLSVEDFHGILQDRSSSHLMEVVMRVLPQSMRPEIQNRFLKGHLGELAMHPVANFVVQALLSSMNSAVEMKWAVKELRGSFPELLRSKRGGVLAAALAAAVRTGTGQVELSKALSAALRELPGNTQGVAAALLTFNLGTRLDSQAKHLRLSTLGCAMLISVLHFLKEGSREFSDSLLELAPKELARAAADPSGSRVLEALLDGGTPKKQSKRLLKKLQGSYGEIASTLSGSFLVEKCYEHAGTGDKELIAEELAASKKLMETPRGAKLMLRCGVAEYKRDSKRWRKQTETIKQLKKDFSEFLDSSEQAPGSIAAKPHLPAEGLADPKPEKLGKARKRGRGAAGVAEEDAAKIPDDRYPSASSVQTAVPARDEAAKPEKGKKSKKALDIVRADEVEAATKRKKKQKRVGSAKSTAEETGKKAGEDTAEVRPADDAAEEKEDMNQQGTTISESSADAGAKAAAKQKRREKKRKDRKVSEELPATAEVARITTEGAELLVGAAVSAAAQQESSELRGGEAPVQGKSVGALLTNGAVILEAAGLANLQVFEDKPKKQKRVTAKPKKEAGKKLKAPAKSQRARLKEKNKARKKTKRLAVKAEMPKSKIRDRAKNRTFGSKGAGLTS